MNSETHNEKEISLNDLVKFSLHSSQTYTGERLRQLMDSIESVGLINPIIVRPAADNKYEIICGHNRAKAMKALGRDVIRADIRSCLSDDEATRLYYDSNLNQQSFADWSYSQKIIAIKYYDAMIRNNSNQGKRNDLIEKTDDERENETCVHTRHKSAKNSSRKTARDKMARQLGISTATFSKYRRIIKLPEDTLKIIGQLLDDKTITFEAAYLISNVEENRLNDLLEYAIKNKASQKIKMDMMKQLSKPLKKGWVRPRFEINEYFELRKKRTGKLKPRL